MAEPVSRGQPWVRVRLGLIAEMSPRVREKIFRGAFPVYPYMYTLRQFRRMNGVRSQDIEEFVLALSGKKLSVREIAQLAQGYFRGPPSFRQALREGHPGRVLEALRQVPEDPDGCNEFERVLLKDLEITQKYMQRVMGKSPDRRLKTPAFLAQAHLLTAGILSQARAFFEVMRKLHDRCGQTQGRISTPPGGDQSKPDRASTPDQPEHGSSHHSAKGRDAGPDDAQRQDPGGSESAEATLRRM